MPFYEYRCDECGHEFESMQKINDDPLTDCPACGKPALRKLISAAGFRLKGSGWYETDFKKGGTKKNLHETVEKKESAKSEGSGSKETQSGGDKPAASKPAEKTVA